MPRRSFRPGAREEFAACLNRVGVGIDSNDVEGIREVSDSSLEFEPSCVRCRVPLPNC